VLLLDIKEAVKNTALELYKKAGLKEGQTVIVGCSTSEILGHSIGTQSNIEIGTVVFQGLYDVFSKYNINIAAQCCEHRYREKRIQRS